MNERVYEILVEKAWCRVTPLIFHWWTGKRRLDGVDYVGPVHSLQAMVASRAMRPTVRVGRVLDRKQATRQRG